MLLFGITLTRLTCTKMANYSEGREGGVLIPFTRKLFFSNPTTPACVAQIEIPFPFFYYFFFMNPSLSAQNPISQPLKKANPSSHFTPFCSYHFAISLVRYFAISCFKHAPIFRLLAVPKFIGELGRVSKF